MQKKVGAGVRSGEGQAGVRMDVNEELKLLLNCKKVGAGFRSGEGRAGVRMDVNEGLKLLLKCKKSRGRKSGQEGAGSGWM